LKSMDLFLDFGLDFLTGLDPGPVSRKNPGPGKTRKFKKCLDLDSGYRKIPGLGPGPARSLVFNRQLKSYTNSCFFTTGNSKPYPSKILKSRPKTRPT